MCILYSIFMVEIVENKNVRFFIGFNSLFVIFVLGRPWASNIRESWSCSQLWTAKSSFCHRPSVGDGILKAGHVQHQLQLPGFWDLCIKALTFTSCLGQSRPPSSLGLFQYSICNIWLFLLPYLLNVANVWWFLLQWQVLNYNWKLNISYMMQLCSLRSGLVVPCMQITPSL